MFISVRKTWYFRENVVDVPKLQSHQIFMQNTAGNHDIYNFLSRYVGFPGAENHYN